MDETLNELAALEPVYEAALEALGNNYADDLMGMFDAMAENYPELKEQLAQAADLSDILEPLLSGTLNDVPPEVIEKNKELIANALREALPVGAMSEIFGDDFWSQTDDNLIQTLIEKMLGGEINMDDLNIHGFGDVLLGLLKGDIETLISNLSTEEFQEGNNLLATLLKGLLDADIDTSTLTDTNLDGALEGMLKTDKLLETAKSGGYDLGAAMPEGAAEGVEDNAQTATDAVGAMASGLVDEFATRIDSHSPSKVFIQFGKDIDDGLAQGLEDNMYAALDPLRKAATRDMPVLGRMMVDHLAAGIRSRQGALVAAMDQVVGAAIDSAMAKLQAFWASVGAMEQEGLENAKNNSGGGGTTINNDITINAKTTSNATQIAKQVTRAQRDLGLLY